MKYFALNSAIHVMWRDQIYFWEGVSLLSPYQVYGFRGRIYSHINLLYVLTSDIHAHHIRMVNQFNGIIRSLLRSRIQHQHRSLHITRPNPLDASSSTPRRAKGVKTKKAYDDLPKYRLNADGMVAAPLESWWGEEHGIEIPPGNTSLCTRFLVFSGSLLNHFRKMITILYVGTHIVLSHECREGREKREHSRRRLR